MLCFGLPIENDAIFCIKVFKRADLLRFYIIILTLCFYYIIILLYLQIHKLSIYLRNRESGNLIIEVDFH
jgi:hypothetical protein